MKRDRLARIALAGPIALFAAMFSTAASIALLEFSRVASIAVFFVLPFALCLWICPDVNLGIRITLGVVNLFISAAVIMLTFTSDRLGISALGLMAVGLYAFPVIILGASLLARRRSGQPLLGTWLLWWVAVAAGFTWMTPLGAQSAILAGGDPLNAMGMLFFPTLGMMAWAGAVAVSWTYERFQWAPNKRIDADEPAV